MKHRGKVLVDWEQIRVLHNLVIRGYDGTPEFDIGRELYDYEMEALEKFEQFIWDRLYAGAVREQYTKRVREGKAKSNMATKSNEIAEACLKTVCGNL